MADLFTASPRRVTALIRLHPAELTAVVCHQDILASFSDEELLRMAAAMAKEIAERETAEPA